MQTLKYILLILPFLILILERFVRNNKEEKPSYKKWAWGGWLLFVSTILLFLFGLFKTVLEDQKTNYEQKEAIKKSITDSLLLSRRWEYDTLKFNQLLDSSKIVISNSLSNIKRTDKTLQSSEKLLNISEVQVSSINKNIQLTKRLNYSLPQTIGFKFHYSFHLEAKRDSILIKYLDSLTNGKDTEVYEKNTEDELINTPGQYYLNYLQIQNIEGWKLRSPIFYFLYGKFDFIKNKKSILRLQLNFFLHNYYKDNNINKDINIIYYKPLREVAIFTAEDKSLTLDEQKGTDITSLLDLTHSDMIFSSSSIFDLGDMKNLTGLYLGLDINGRIIDFSHLPYFKVPKDVQSHLNKYGIDGTDCPIIMVPDLKEEQLKGIYDKFQVF